MIKGFLAELYAHNLYIGNFVLCCVCSRDPTIAMRGIAMSPSIEEIIDEKVMNLVMFLTSIIGDKVPQEDLQKIASRLELFGNDIKKIISDTSSKLEFLENDNKQLRQRISMLTNENAELKRRIEILVREIKRLMRRLVRIRILRKKLQKEYD